MAEQVVGIEKEKLDEDDDTGAVGTTLKGTVEEAAAAAAEANPMFGNASGADGTKAASLAGWVEKEPEKKKEIHCYWISSQWCSG